MSRERRRQQSTVRDLHDGLRSGGKLYGIELHGAPLGAVAGPRDRDSMFRAWCGGGGRLYFVGRHATLRDAHMAVIAWTVTGKQPTASMLGRDHELN